MLGAWPLHDFTEARSTGKSCPCALDADTMIVPYGEGQVIYERRGALEHTGDHDWTDRG